MSILNIGKDFSDEPQGRFYKDCEGSGEEFREEYLRNRLETLGSNELLTVILDDNVDGYGSSFLTEGFAGIVKYGYMRKDALISKLEFKYDDQDFAFYEKKIKQYINEAIFASVKYVPTRT